MTVLRTYEVISDKIEGGIIFICLAVILAFMIIASSCIHGYFHDLAMLIFPVIFAIIGIVFIVNNRTPIKRIDCLIEDKTSLVEIYEKYNVMGHDGLIWTLEERKSNETD